ncbi:sugar transferase [Telmatospirillum sp. J64-1]|uniref:sugar transferase n=1 Tax=Telmatospirillum sp. J64-1 TaxID=2502183 RepID=UPI00272D26FB|nr:sugar transferase [Telmatospirillum sp. J64-1]
MVALLFLALPLLVLALAIRLDSPGSPLFLQTRLGRHGRPFRIFKLRTMYRTAQGDVRISRLGRLIRRLGIDELPQLINVLMGDMALIGPRPLTLEDSRDYLTHASERFAVLPGITGLAQATGRHLSSRQRERLDCFYVRKSGVGMTRVVLLRTLRSVLRRPVHHPKAVLLAEMPAHSVSAE